jgi:hypothetical protein
MKKNENSIRNKGILSLVLIILLFVLVRFALLYIGAKLGETRENELIQLKMSALTDIVSDANANSTAAAERVSCRLTAETRLMTGMLKEFCSEGSYDGPRTLPGGFIQKNLNGNKSIYIEREIGQRPVLAFGNSGSDTSMLNYTIDSRNPYPAQAYMVVADDNVREWGTQDWETKSADYMAKGYVPISMKNDFARIYAEGITPAAQQFREREWNTAFSEEEAA